MDDVTDLSHKEIFRQHMAESRFFVSRLYMQGDDAAEIINMAHHDENDAAEALLDAASYVDNAACERLDKPLGPFDRIIGGEAINPFGVTIAIINTYYGTAGVVEVWTDAEMAVRARPDYAIIRRACRV